jgi:hypothetical protein
LGKANAAQASCAAFYYSLPDRASVANYADGARTPLLARGSVVLPYITFFVFALASAKNDKNKKYHRASDVTEERSSADTTSYDFSTLK